MTFSAVEVAAPKPFEVKRDVAITGSLNGCDYLIPPSNDASEFIEFDFDPCSVVVVAHSYLGEPEPVQRCFGSVDSAQNADRHLGAVRDARCQARCRRLVPRPQTEVLRRGSNVRFGKARVDQRKLGAGLLCCLLARAVITQIVDIHTQHNRRLGDAGDGVTTSINSALQWKHRSMSLSRYAARSISWVTTGVQRRPHS